MTKSQLTEARVDLLDSIHTLASEPVTDLDGIKAQVEELFLKLEGMADGKEETGTTGGKQE